MLSGCSIVLVDGVVFSLELAAYFPFSYRLCLVDGTRMTLLAMREGERGRMVALAPTPAPSALPQLHYGVGMHVLERGYYCTFVP